MSATIKQSCFKYCIGCAAVDEFSSLVAPSVSCSALCTDGGDISRSRENRITDPVEGFILNTLPAHENLRIAFPSRLLYQATYTVLRQRHGSVSRRCPLSSTRGCFAV